MSVDPDEFAANLARSTAMSVDEAKAAMDSLVEVLKTEPSLTKHRPDQSGTERRKIRRAAERRAAKAARTITPNGEPA